MDTIIKMPAPEKPKIPENLIKATMETMKAGIIVDRREKELKEAREQEAAAQAALKNKGKPTVSEATVMMTQRQLLNPQASVVKADSDDDQSLPSERNYRAHQDRRFGFLLIGDQHRLSGGKDQFLYPSCPPLDYSFCLLNTIEEIVVENEQPQLKRNFRHPVKTEDDRYRTSSLRLSYNVLQGVDDLVNTLYKILDGGPFGLCWLDLSFNSISKFDDDTFSQLPNLKIMYLHGNNIADMLEVPKLASLPSLRSLTLHGNPIEQEDAYRICVLFYLPRLLHLDFVGVTKGDKANSSQFGGSYEKHWKAKHNELERRVQALKESQEMSLTQRIMLAENEDDVDVI